MEVSIKIKDLPRRDQFTHYRVYGSWSPANIVKVFDVNHQAAEDELLLELQAPSRKLYTTDAIYVATEMLINGIPTTHGNAAFNLYEICKNENNADSRYDHSLERVFSDYHTPDESRKQYGKALVTVHNMEQFRIVPSPYMSHEKVKEHAKRWCEQKARFWLQFQPAVAGLDGIVLKHFISPNGYTFPPEMFMSLITQPMSYDTLLRSIHFALHVFQLSIDTFVDTMNSLGKQKMSKWSEFITYNIIGFALELFSLSVIYHSDEDEDLTTGKVEATERMEMAMFTFFSDCEEKGHKIVRTIASFLVQHKFVMMIGMDPVMLSMLIILKYYVSMLTTNSTNDSALDKNSNLNKVIDGPENNGHVTALFVPKKKFYRRHPSLHHVENWSEINAEIEDDRPFLEILMFEGTGYQSVLMNTFRSYLGPRAESCIENIQRVSDLLKNSPLSGTLSSFIFNTDFTLKPNETPNGFIRYITSAYVYNEKHPLRQVEFRPFNEQLKYGITIYELLNDKVYWVPCMPFDDNVIREMKYQLEHLPRTRPDRFRPPVVPIPPLHYRGTAPNNGCSSTMIQSLYNLTYQDIEAIDRYLSLSEEFDHFDLSIIPLGERSMLVVRLTPIDSSIKLRNLGNWFMRNYGEIARLRLIRWSQSAGGKHVFELVLADLVKSIEYSLIISLQKFDEAITNQLYDALSKLFVPEVVSLRFTGEELIIISNAHRIAIQHKNIYDILFRERDVERKRTIPLRTSFGRFPQFPPLYINDVDQRRILYEDVIGNEVRNLDIPYDVVLIPPSPLIPTEETLMEPVSLTYDPETRIITLPNSATIKLAADEPPPQVQHFPIKIVVPEEIKVKEKVDEEEKKPVPAPAPAPAPAPLGVADARNSDTVIMHEDGSITVDTYRLMEEIYTKHVYIFDSLSALKAAFPTHFKATAYCTIVRKNYAACTFFVDVNPIVLELFFRPGTAPSIAEEKSGVLELRDDGDLTLNGTVISDCTTAYLVDDPQVILCGIMLRNTDEMLAWSTPLLLQHATGDIILKTLKRPSLMQDVLGTSSITLKNPVYDSKTRVYRADLDSDGVYHRGIVFDVSTPPNNPRSLRLSTDAIYLDSTMRPYPNALLYIRSSVPISEREWSAYDNLLPDLLVTKNENSECDIIADCVDIGKNLFFAYNCTSMVLYNDLLELLFLLEMDNPTVLCYDFTTCEEQFVEIDGNRFSFSLKLHSSEHLSWSQFFRRAYDSMISVAERAEFLHYLNQFAESSTFVSKRQCTSFNPNYYYVMIGSVLWVYEHSASDFFEIKQILNIDQFLHMESTTWDDKLLFAFNIWASNFENRNFVPSQNLMLANVHLAIRELRV